MTEQKTYTREDFLDGTEPFEYCYQFRDNKFKLKRELEKMSAIANLTGVRNFKTLFTEYCAEQRKLTNPGISNNATDFENQPLELDTGSWMADDDGVTGFTQFGEIEVCSHPIMPIQRLINVDTGLEKINLAYKRGGKKGVWRNVIVDKKTVATANNITNLSEYGISVTSENAKYLVKYLQDVEDRNHGKIPENNSVTRLGWIGDHGFSPYMEDLIYDGDQSFMTIFENVRQVGSFEKWKSVAKEARSNDLYVRIVLAASFASALVEPTNSLPFFVHLWGGSESGKTVAALLAASVWANPMLGKYAMTFDGTYVFQELLAGFLNSMPLILDELQIDKDRKDFDKMIYKLSEGTGRGRGAKQGGIQKLKEWKNTMITTGEYPLLHGSSGGGAVNRVIDLNCEDKKLFTDPRQVIKDMQANYGFAGKAFVDKLQDNLYLEVARTTQDKYLRELQQGESTDKQSISASLILTADKLISEMFFDNDRCLEVQEIEKYLANKADVSQNVRAYAWLQDWISQNINKFQKDSPEVYGVIDPSEKLNRFVYINRSIFEKACTDNGFNSRSFLSWLRSNDKIETGSKGFTKPKWTGLTTDNLIWLKMENPSREIQEEIDEIPPF